MKRILLNTVFSNLLAVLSFAVILLFDREQRGLFFYFVIMGCGNTFVPTFLAVLLYHFLKKKIYVNNRTQTFWIRILVLLLILPLCLVLWSVIDVIDYNGGFSNFTINAVIADYKSEFAGGFTIIAFMLAFSIPSFDLLLGRKAAAEK